MSLLTGLLSYYKFDENTGTLVADATGNGHDGTWHGTLGSQWTPGIINSGGNFNATNSYVQATISSGLDGSFTYAPWVDIQSLVPTGTIGMSFVSSYGNYWFDLVQLFDGTNYRFRANLYDGTNNPFCDSTTIVLPNTKYQVGLVRDTSTGKLLLYVNGNLDASVTDTTTSVPAYGNFYMGLDVGRLNSDQLIAMLDEAPLYSRALSPAEFSQLYNGGLGLQYPFTTSALSMDFLFPNTSFREKVTIIGY